MRSRSQSPATVRVGGRGHPVELERSRSARR
jgi:hypothetical protein